MASPDTQPWVYDFRYNYYQNFYRNRLQQMSASGSILKLMQDAWLDNDSTKVVDGVVVNNGVDIRYYVQKHYNGDTPDCLADALAKQIDYLLNDSLTQYADPVVRVMTYISNEINKFFNDLLGTFICTATTDTLGTECGNRLLTKLKAYRDDVILSSEEGVAMIRYYGVIGPQIVRAMEEDSESEVVYKYVYAEYISQLSKLIDDGKHVELMRVYFMMLNDMADRYGIKTSKRFKEWLHN